LGAAGKVEDPGQVGDRVSEADREAEKVPFSLGRLCFRRTTIPFPPPQKELYSVAPTGMEVIFLGTGSSRSSLAK
jgi:hypothetical protein